MTTIKIIVDVRGGIVHSIYGDAPPKNVQLELVVRDHDSIDAGDEDPLHPSYSPEIFYW